MSLPSGYRFFRDDALLKAYERGTRYCDRCDELYWADEVPENPYGTTYCPKCINLFNSRIDTLESNRSRASCPINSQEFIFSKKYHKHSGRGKKKSNYDQYLRQKEYEEEYENRQRLEKLKNFWRIVKPKTIKELIKQREILEADYYLKKFDKKGD